MNAYVIFDKYDTSRSRLGYIPPSSSTITLMTEIAPFTSENTHGELRVMDVEEIKLASSEESGTLGWISGTGGAADAINF